MAKSSALNKITSRAKQLRKINPKLKWIDAVKKASGEYRSGTKTKTAPPKKVGATKFLERGESKKTPVKRTIRIERKANGTIKSFKKVAGHNGAPQMALTAIAACMRDLRWCDDQIVRLKQDIKKSGISAAEKQVINRDISRIKKMSVSYRKHLTQLKRHL